VITFMKVWPLANGCFWRDTVKLIGVVTALLYLSLHPPYEYLLVCADAYATHDGRLSQDGSRGRRAALP
jgi:hypothetical protein